MLEGRVLVELEDLNVRIEAIGLLLFGERYTEKRRELRTAAMKRELAALRPDRVSGRSGR